MILDTLRKQNPEPHCELYYTSPFQLLVSVVLSAQATDKQVNKVMQPLYDKGFTPDTVRTWGEAGLLAHIRSIGLAPTKAKNIFKLSLLIQENFQDQVPNTREQLESLPGVGRKTANVILGELFKEPTLAVDTHVFRVTKRLGLHNENQAEKAEQVLLDIIPANYLPAAHHWFILLGRYTCKARKPECYRCDLVSICPSKQGTKDLADSLKD
ncbi:MAG: endonuclease III [Proteobacteria bacterium]|nr:endonuclease III [Pseudomonadota bacterium]